MSKSITNPKYTIIGKHTNCFKLGNNVFIVTSQSGFEQALYEYWKDCGYSKSEIRKGINHFPLQYPSLISVNSMHGYCETNVNVCHPDFAKAILNVIYSDKELFNKKLKERDDNNNISNDSSACS